MGEKLPPDGYIGRLAVEALQGVAHISDGARARVEEGPGLPSVERRNAFNTPQSGGAREWLATIARVVAAQRPLCAPEPQRRKLYAAKIGALNPLGEPASAGTSARVAVMLGVAAAASSGGPDAYRYGA
jgi:hypothetical protein